MSIVVKISSSLRNEFAKTAKEAYPCEDYCIVLGKRRGNVLTVKKLFFPANRGRYSSSTHILISLEAFEEAYEMAEFLGMEVLGDLHSHPYDPDDFCPKAGVDHAPSQGDWTTAPKDWLVGICVVRQAKNKRKLASFKWWIGSPNAIEVLT